MPGWASIRSNIRVYPCSGMAWYVSVKYRSSRFVRVGTREVTLASSSDGSSPHCFRVYPRKNFR